MASDHIHYDIDKIISVQAQSRVLRVRYSNLPSKKFVLNTRYSIIGAFDYEDDFKQSLQEILVEENL